MAGSATVPAVRVRAAVARAGASRAVTRGQGTVSKAGGDVEVRDPHGVQIAAPDDHAFAVREDVSHDRLVRPEPLAPGERVGRGAQGDRRAGEVVGLEVGADRAPDGVAGDTAALAGVERGDLVVPAPAACSSTAPASPRHSPSEASDPPSVTSAGRPT